MPVLNILISAHNYKGRFKVFPHFYWHYPYFTCQRKIYQSIHYLLVWEFFTPAFLTRVWVTASLLKSPDSSRYFGRSWQCWSRYGNYLSSFFQIFQSFYQAFGDCPKSINHNWYHRHFHVHGFFSTRARSTYLSSFSLSFIFTSVTCRNDKVYDSACSPFFVDYYKVWSSGLILGDPFVSPNPREFGALSFSGSRLCIYHFFAWSNLDF